MSQACILSDLKFAGMRPALEHPAGENPDSSQHSTNFQRRLAQQVETRPTNRDPHNHDKLASDKPGEELAPDASIWNVYAEEAKEYDNDLVADRNRNLDTMLLFAGLFSAILTAFLVGSMGMLQRDSAQTSMTILLGMAQSQWRMEIGRPDVSSPLPEIPMFTPTTSARWINTLWFMALAVSLSAAMMAMLAKEWLSAYTASMPRHPYEFALKRQARLDALASWNALQIIDFLPSLLNFSLVLFTLGLITHLWLLDRVIALIIATASATLGISHLAVVVLGAATDACPYRTRVSRYIKLLFERYEGSTWGWIKPSAVPAAYSNIESDDLRALQWLADHARDPIVGDSACQALAGLRSRKLRELDLQFKPNGRFDATSKQIIEDYEAGMKVGTWVLHRLSNSLSKYPRELAFCKGMNSARYASTLSEIYSYACRCTTYLQQFDPRAIGLSGRERKIQDIVQLAHNFKTSAFEALDAIWSNDCPQFTSDAYAGLTAAELRLIGSALDEIEGSTTTHSAEVEKIESDHTSIAFAPGEIPTAEKDAITVPDLRARYSRALCRAGFQLYFHSNGRAPIGNFELIDILQAIHELTIRDGLDSMGTVMTHHPQDASGVSVPMVVFITGASGYRMLEPNDIGDEDGLLAGLTTLLGSASVTASPKVDVATANAMSAVGPKLINQWIKIQENFPHIDITAFNYCQPLTWPSLNRVGEPRSPTLPDTATMPRTKCVIAQLLETAHFAISYFDHPGICELPDIALESLYNRTSSSRSARHAAHEVILPRIGMLKHWIDSVGRIETEKQRDRSWSWAAKTNLLRLLAIRNQDKKTIFDYLLLRMTSRENGAENIRLFIVLEIMSTVSGYTEDIRRLLENISSCVRDEYAGNYSQCFTSMSDGFHCLQAIGSHPDYAGFVAQTILNLITYLAERSQDNSGWMKASAVPGFLSAVSFVCRHPPPQWGKRSNLFIPAVILTLQQLDIRSIAPYLTVQTTLDDLKSASEHMSNKVSKARFELACGAIEMEVKVLKRAVEDLGQGIRAHSRRLKPLISVVTTEAGLYYEGKARSSTF